MNDHQESGGATPQPLKTVTQATKTEGEVPQETPVVGWAFSIRQFYKRLTCPQCGNNSRLDLILSIREINGITMPFYTCRFCKCQFTRKPRFEDVIDRQGRI